MSNSYTFCSRLDTDNTQVPCSKNSDPTWEQMRFKLIIQTPFILCYFKAMSWLLLSYKTFFLNLKLATLKNDAHLTTAGDQLPSQHAHPSRSCSGTYLQLCANDRTVWSKGQQQVVQVIRQLFSFTQRLHSRVHRYQTRTRIWVGKTRLTFSLSSLFVFDSLFITYFI